MPAGKNQTHNTADCTAHVTCSACGRKGHYGSDCRQKTNSGEMEARPSKHASTSQRANAREITAATATRKSSAATAIADRAIATNTTALGAATNSAAHTSTKNNATRMMGRTPRADKNQRHTGTRKDQQETAQHGATPNQKHTDTKKDHQEKTQHGATYRRTVRHP